VLCCTVQAELDRLTKELTVVSAAKTRNYNAGVKFKAESESYKKQLADAMATKQNLETTAADLQKRVAELETAAAAAAPAAAAGASEAQRFKSAALNFKRRAEAVEKVRGGCGRCLSASIGKGCCNLHLLSLDG
jgi:septal ring factor EnvC (AmiA/AmiB activator)